MKRVALVFLISLGLAGCGIIHNRNNDYLKAKKAPMLQGQNIHEDYPVAGPVPQGKIVPASKIPPGSLLSQQKSP